MDKKYDQTESKISRLEVDLKRYSNGFRFDDRRDNALDMHQIIVQLEPDKNYTGSPIIQKMYDRICREVCNESAI